MTALLPVAALFTGLLLMIWSADRLVEGAAAVARHFAVPPLLVGMVVVGFGHSAPELVVSVHAATQGHPLLALGNAWGSGIANMALVLGVTALVAPVHMRSPVLRRELPLLLGSTALSALLAGDLQISRVDAGVLLAAFGVLVFWTVHAALEQGRDAPVQAVGADRRTGELSLAQALLRLLPGLLLLAPSARWLVWGSVEIAQGLGIGDLVMGLTVVSVGTTLPELAACVQAARRGEDDIALGNVLGSSLFNSLAVVGLAGAIEPMDLEPAVLTRDLPVMATLGLWLFLRGRRCGSAPIARREAGALLAAYAGYTVWLLWTMGPR